MEIPYYDDAYVGIGLIILVATLFYLAIDHYDTDENLNSVSKLIISLLASVVLVYAIGRYTYTPDEILTGNYWD